MLSRILNKKYNYESTVIDPRGYPLIGVPNIAEEFQSNSPKNIELVTFVN